MIQYKIRTVTNSRYKHIICLKTEVKQLTSWKWHQTIYLFVFSAQVLKTFLSLRIKEIHRKEDDFKDKRKVKEEKRKIMSRREKKVLLAFLRLKSVLNSISSIIGLHWLNTCCVLAITWLFFPVYAIMKISLSFIYKKWHFCHLFSQILVHESFRNLTASLHVQSS